MQPPGRLRILNGASILYSDLLSPSAQLWQSRLIPQSYAVQTTALTRAAYTYPGLGKTYLVCENDRAVPAEYQRGFAERAGASVQVCGAGHSPMLSAVEMLVERIVRVVEEEKV